MVTLPDNDEGRPGKGRPRNGLLKNNTHEHTAEALGAMVYCDSCGQPVDEPARWRHVSCPLPDWYRAIRTLNVEVDG